MQYNKHNRNKDGLYLGLALTCIYHWFLECASPKYWFSVSDVVGYVRSVLGKFAMLSRAGVIPSWYLQILEGSERGKSLYYNRDSEWGTLPQRKVSTARGLIERELVGWCLRCRLWVGDTFTLGHTCVGDSDEDTSISGVGLRQRTLPLQRVSTTGKPTGCCLCCRLRVGDTPTSERTSASDYSQGHAHQRGRDWNGSIISFDDSKHSARNLFKYWGVIGRCILLSSLEARDHSIAWTSWSCVIVG